jgi:surface antigen
MKSIPAKLLIGVFICAFALSATASNLKWLRNSAAINLTEEDWRLAKEAADKALNEATDGTTVSWENEDTGASGSSTPLKSGKKDGMRCRYLKLISVARGISGEMIFLFCKHEDGIWRINVQRNKSVAR